MSVLEDMKRILKSVLGLGREADSFERDSLLLGNIPEFDSQAVVSVLVALEEHFDIVIEDDDVTAEVFETIGSLVEFVNQKL